MHCSAGLNTKLTGFGRPAPLKNEFLIKNLPEGKQNECFIIAITIINTKKLSMYLLNCMMGLSIEEPNSYIRK